MTLDNLGPLAVGVDPLGFVRDRQALLAGAVNRVVIHNHPSGDPVPSRED
jgi:hypothetical protein